MNRPQIFLLGTFHLNRPENGDLLRPQIFDVESNRRQTEIEEVVNQLIALVPTKVALEATPEKEAMLVEQYADYRKNTFVLSHQMYLQLARIGRKGEGASWVAQYWFFRNLLIFRNLLKLIEHKEERILCIYGAAHLYLLKQYLQESGEVVVLTWSDL